MSMEFVALIHEIKNVSKTKLYSVALVREQTVPTEWSPLVSEVSDNFCG
jgi:hypothetical protein